MLNNKADNNFSEIDSIQLIILLSLLHLFQTDFVSFHRWNGRAWLKIAIRNRKLVIVWNGNGRCCQKPVYQFDIQKKKFNSVECRTCRTQCNYKNIQYCENLKLCLKSGVENTQSTAIQFSHSIQSSKKKKTVFFYLRLNTKIHFNDFNSPKTVVDIYFWFRFSCRSRTCRLFALLLWKE